MNTIAHISKEQYYKLVKKPKYGNKRTDGFASKHEAAIVKQFDTAYKGKAIKNYDIQISFKLAVNGKHITTYRADIVVKHLDNSIEIVDAKGVRTKEFDIKWALMQAVHPEFIYTLIYK